MIIQIRGTSGSGKTTVVNEVMKLYGERKPMMAEKRRLPAAYTLKHPNYKHTDLRVLGHYESPCGGCDTLPPAQSLFETVRRHHEGGYDVMFEGLLASEDTKWTTAILKHLPIVIILLDTPLEVCFEGIAARRAAKGNLNPVDPKNTTNRVNTIERACRKLALDHFLVEKHSRESAVTRIREFLHV